MTPEQRKAEIVRLRREISNLDEGVFGCSCFDSEDEMCANCCSDMRDIKRHKAQLAALEAESGHEPKEKQDGEA